MVGVVEDVGRRRVDGDGAGVRGRDPAAGRHGWRGSRDGATGSDTGGYLVEGSGRRGSRSAGEAGGGWRRPVVSVGRTKKPQLRASELRPRDRSSGPGSPVLQAAVASRPHPPHGGAASACTCSRRWWWDSRWLEYEAPARILARGPCISPPPRRLSDHGVGRPLDERGVIAHTNALPDGRP